eukprot:1160974-Pelagomonas_calceolata.AAC.5
MMKRGDAVGGNRGSVLLSSSLERAYRQNPRVIVRKECELGCSVHHAQPPDSRKATFHSSLSMWLQFQCKM